MNVSFGITCELAVSFIVTFPFCFYVAYFPILYAPDENTYTCTFFLPFDRYNPKCELMIIAVYTMQTYFLSSPIFRLVIKIIKKKINMQSYVRRI